MSGAAPQPRALATMVASLVPVATEYALKPPLSMIAREKSPAARGEASSAATELPPDDCPKMVTLVLSPPKCPMLARTKSSAATWSRSP